jgi:protein-L-isoaspartate(D-aspartate) O-methyltransferase
VRAIPDRFRYQGPARDYFLRATAEQVELASPRARLATLGLLHLWTGLTAPRGFDPATSVSDDDLLLATAREARAASLRASGVDTTSVIGQALVSVPRERFVRIEDVADSAQDRPFPLDDVGAATVSAMHAYAMAFEALDLQEGDALVDLGGGSGYGSAVAAAIVGPRGHVLSIEIDADLTRRASALLAGTPTVDFVQGDAHDVDRWRGARKVYAAFALADLPAAWIEGLGEDGVLVAPVASRGGEGQTFVRVSRTARGVVTESLSRVIYVADRGRPGGYKTEKTAAR